MNRKRTKRPNNLSEEREKKREEREKKDEEKEKSKNKDYA